jgi:hypothetical protein
MTPKKKALGVTLLLIIYVVIAAIGFFIAYLVKVNFIEPQNQQTKPRVTQAPAPSGFKTYESKDQNFSFYYPNELNPQENAVGFGVKTVELRSVDNADPAYSPDIQILTVPKALARSIGQDFEGYYELREGESKTIESPIGEKKSAEQFTKVKNREINGLRAIDYTSVPSPNPENQEPEIGTFVEVGNNLVIFATSPDNKEQLEEVLQTFNYSQ